MQIFSGNIKLDKKFIDGARFIIEIPKKEKRRNGDE